MQLTFLGCVTLLGPPQTPLVLQTMIFMLNLTYNFLERKEKIIVKTWNDINSQQGSIFNLFTTLKGKSSSNWFYENYIYLHIYIHIILHIHL